MTHPLSSNGRTGTLALALVLSGLLGAAPTFATVDLSSPRATFRSFLDAMNAPPPEGPRLEEAAACLDLTSAPVLLRSQGPQLALDLKRYLDRTEIVVLAEIPEEVGDPDWTWRRSREGEISMQRGEDGSWRFSAGTMASLPALIETVRGRAALEGIGRDVGGASSLAGWIRSLLPESMRGRLFFLENWQWVGLFALALAGVVVDRLLRLFLGFWLRRLFARSVEARSSIEGEFEKPIGILAMALVWRAALPVLDLPVTALAALTLATKLVIAAAGVWAVYRLVDLLSAHFAVLATRTESRVDDILIPLIRRALKIVVLAFGVLFVAQNLNVDITSLLAGLGIGGLAFALAAKDTVENLFGSVTVLVDRPFQIGDWVSIGDQEGTVEEIGFRSTRIRTFYNSLITIPNSRLVNTAVDNLGVRRYRRVKCMLGIQYDTPAEKIDAFCEGIRELIRRHPYTRKDFYMVYFNQFGQSSLDVLLYAFHETPDWGTELRERHRLFVDIVRLAGRLDVHFAFPTRTLHLASAPAGLVPDPPAPSPGEEASADPAAAELGRAAARAIAAGLTRQPPVDFDDPERIRPDAPRH